MFDRGVRGNRRIQGVVGLGVTLVDIDCARAAIGIEHADDLNTDLAGRKTSPCHVLLQVKSGAFQRIFPSKVGTFDCAKKNVIQVKLEVY